MPNTSPVADNSGTIQLIKDAAARDAVVRVLPTGCITVGMKGQALAPIGSLKRAGVVAITDDGECVQSNDLMRRAVEYARMFDLPVMDHCQDYSMTQGAVMNEGVVSTRLGLRGWPNAAEDMIVARNVILSEYTGAPHPPAAHLLEVLRRCHPPRQEPRRPHHRRGHAPPPRPHRGGPRDLRHPFQDEPAAPHRGRPAGAHRRFARRDARHHRHGPRSAHGLREGQEFDFAPNGILGLETALPVVLDVLVRRHRFKLSTVIDLMTRRPARVLNLPGGTLAEGAEADLCLFDPEEQWRYDAKAGFSKSANSPWSGQTLTGRVRTTLVGGRIVFRDGRIVV
jgi:dihydroorotase